MSEATVQLWCVDETEFVFARTEAEAISFAKMAFAMRNEISGDEDAVSAEPFPPEKLFTFTHENGHEEIASAAEWCKDREPGHFATSEY